MAATFGYADYDLGCSWHVWGSCWLQVLSAVNVCTRRKLYQHCASCDLFFPRANPHPTCDLQKAIASQCSVPNSRGSLLPAGIGNIKINQSIRVRVRSLKNQLQGLKKWSSSTRGDVRWMGASGCTAPRSFLSLVHEISQSQQSAANIDISQKIVVHVILQVG